MREKRCITAGYFIDGNGAVMLRNVFLTVEEGFITSIGEGVDLKSDNGMSIDDYSQCIVLPALVDCSIYMFSSPSVDEKVRQSAEEATLPQKNSLMKRHIGYCHSYGVLGAVVNDATTELYNSLYAVEKKGLINIKTTNDFIRIRYPSTIDDRSVSPSELSFVNLCSSLQNRGRKKAVVVANGRKAVEEALIAGCDAIEQGYEMGEDNLNIMAQKNILWIPSLMHAKNALDGSGSDNNSFCRFSHRYQSSKNPVPGEKHYWEKILNEHMQLLKKARSLGVDTAVGTGAGSVGILHGESMVEEMKLYKKAGYSLEETFKCASKNGAKFFGMQELGALSVGAKATFLIARGAVQQLPRKLSYLEAVYINGKPSPYYCKNPVIKS